VEIRKLSENLKTAFPECEIMTISSVTGDGVEKWLGKVLGSSEAGRHILDLDYDRYAEGEAVLGWLNCSATLTGIQVDWDLFTSSLMRELALEFDSKRLTVGHVKAIVETGNRYIAANQTGTIDTLNFRWSAGTGDQAEMIVNARVEMSPEDLESLFLETLRKTTNGHISAIIKRLRCIRPGYPRPTYRYDFRV
jgi:hypothetical protein